MRKSENKGMEWMTTGSPWKAIILFFIPLFIGNLFQQFYSMADAVLVGRLIGVKELAGVGATEAMNFLIIGFATGITSGFSVVLAHRAGAGNVEKLRSSVAVTICLCGGITVVLTAVAVAAAGPLLTLMNTPEDIYPFAFQYIIVIFAGLGATIYYNMIAGILRAIGDSKTPLFFLMFSSVLNIILDLTAILRFHAGVGGAAAATVFAQLISAIVCHAYAVRKYPQIRVKRQHFECDKIVSNAWRHLRIGLPMALQFSVTAVGIMIFQAYLNRFGSLVIAGYTAAGKVENLVTQPFITLAVTMEVFCGQNCGAGNKNRVRQGIRSSLIMGMGFAAAAAALNLLFGRQMIAVFLETYDARIVEYGYRYLVIIAIFFWLLCALQIVRSSLQGMGEALVPMFGGVIELLARWGGCVMLVDAAGYVGVYMATPLAWGLALALLLAWYIWGMREEVRK